MAEILTISSAEVKIGEDDGKVVTVPIASLQFSNPQVGDRVNVFRDGDDFIVRRTETVTGVSEDGARTINKHVFVWVAAFMFGAFGIDHFLRGQTALGVFKLLLNTFGWITIVGGFAGWIWDIIDWINAMTKAYGSAYGRVENLTFDEDGNYTKQGNVKWKLVFVLLRQKIYWILLL